MSAYMVIRARIDNPDAFSRYAKVVPALVKKYGGQYRVMGGPITVLEGEWPEGWTVVISEWPDKAAAEKFWQSEDYRQAISLRENTGEFEVILLNGLTEKNE
jgi:uncharacterized protein (DUF1330 family)